MIFRDANNLPESLIMDNVSVSLNENGLGVDATRGAIHAQAGLRMDKCALSSEIGLLH